MADDANAIPRPPKDPHVQAAPTANALPAPAAEPAGAGPRFSLVDSGKRLLRSGLNLVVGAAVGALGGVLLSFTLLPLLGWNIDYRLVIGGGLLLGVFFNHTVVRLLHLTPRKELEAQAAAGKTADEGSAPSPVRETVEMLVSVVILVVLLKSFDAEAYVIPTGSMAETLYGDQKEVVCPSCGYHFPVDCSDQVDTMKATNHPVTGCTCPNCRQHIVLFQADPNDKTRSPEQQWHDSNPPPNEILDPGPSSGDRILAAKFTCDLLDTPPNRLDVVVFKFPGNPSSEEQSFPPWGAFHDGVQINYIKRLVGLPGETIAIHGGDLYVLPADKGPRYDGDLAEAAKTSYGMNPAVRMWEVQYEHTRRSKEPKDADSVELALFKKGAFQILRKSPETLLAMRRIVYDNDHPAKDLVDLHQPSRWADRQTGTGWTSDGNNGFHVAAGDAAAERRLSYSHLVRDPQMEFNTEQAKLKVLLQDATIRAQIKARMKEILNSGKPENLRGDDEKKWQQKVEEESNPDRLLDFDPLDATPEQQIASRKLRDSYLENMLDDLRQAYSQQKPQLITDFMGYNTGELEHGLERPKTGVNWVGDLILECQVQADPGQGQLTLELSKGVDHFQARFDLGTGDCALHRIRNAGARLDKDHPENNEKDEELDHKQTALKGGGKHSVRLANVDQRLTVWVDEALPFGDGVPYDPPKTEGPTDNDLQPASIAVKGAGASVQGLRLWRDTYYTTADDLNPRYVDPSDPRYDKSRPIPRYFNDPSMPDVAFDPRDKATWAKLRDLPTRTMYVQPDCYLCMGDNSPRSSDGRFWGLVPKRLLLGKAIAVFYPLDRFERIR